jgi:hypothetical protein
MIFADSILQIASIVRFVSEAVMAADQRNFSRERNA